MHSMYDVIKKPIVTEKGSALKAEAGKVVFAVDRHADKIAIKNAVEKLFDVKVTSVHTMVFRGKDKRVGKSTGRRKNWKKAERLKEEKLQRDANDRNSNNSDKP